MSKKIMAASLLSFFIFSQNAISSEVIDNKSPEKSGGEFVYSKDSVIKSQQEDVYKVINLYQNYLNSGETSKILSLFSSGSFSQWNNSVTADSDSKRKEQYNSLFKKEKFRTEFAFDTIYINGDTAIVRTHHHLGAVVNNIEENKTVIDLNREVFVLNKVDGKWKIFLYTFNTNPLQGVS
ncbi:nuclear transport factor 2 family protein [Rosenbergiella epipactidis]|uniref:nuclear transport factor 2 family protein n=1 Tax=Rosenbergiella epipactidis TaxID=1544694 RepID=UPI001F4D821A|nr:nuclear transport factor 2 family protein [Rosenbergiella epipactidis]